MDRHEWFDSAGKKWAAISGAGVRLHDEIIASKAVGDEILRLAEIEMAHAALRKHIPEWEAIEKERDRLAEEVERLKAELEATDEVLRAEVGG